MLIESTDVGWYHYEPFPPHSLPDQPQYATPTGIYQSVCTVYLYLPIASTPTVSDRSYPVPLTDKPQPSKILAFHKYLINANPTTSIKMKQPFTM